MAARSVEIRFTGSTAQLESALRRAGLVADESGSKIGSAFEHGAGRAGGAISKLGQTAASWGIPFAASLETIGKHLDTATGKTQKLHSAMSEAGKVTLLAGGAGLAAVAAEAVKLGQSYETAQAKIQSATGASAKSAQALTHAFAGTAGSSMESGQAMETAYANVAGQLKLTEHHALSTAEAMKFTAAANRLAEASGVDVATAYSATASTMQAFHLAAGQAAQTTDTLYNVSQAVHVPVDTLATSMAKLHSRLGELAPSLGDVAGLVTALGARGVQGSRGIQVVNSAFQTLVSSSKPTTETLKALGVSVFDQSGRFIGLQNVIGQLQPKLAGLTQQQRLFAEQALFGKGAAQIMGQVVEAGVPAFQHATAAAEKHGTALRGAEAQSKTFHGEMQTLKATVETLGGSLGLVLIPKLTAAAKALADGVQWLEKHKTAATVLAGVITGVLGAAVAVFAYDKAVAFGKGLQRMTSGLAELASKVTGTSGVIKTQTAEQAAATEAASARMAAANDAAFATAGPAAVAGTAAAETAVAGEATAVTAADATIEAENVAAGKSFTAMLGPIGAVVAAVLAAQPLINKLTGGGLGEQSYEEAFLKKHPPEGEAFKAKAKEQHYLDTSGGIMAFFEAKGLSPAAAAGIVGNAQQESSLNPNAAGGGLFQDIGSRAASGHGSITHQLEAAWKELLAMPGTLAALKAAKTPQEAARIFSQQFERPGEPRLASRELYAAQALKVHPHSTAGQAQQEAQKQAEQSNAAIQELMEGKSKGKAEGKSKGKAKKPKKPPVEPYVDPFEALQHVGRTDQGVDYTAKVGSRINAIGTGVIDAIVKGWYKGQPLVEEMLTQGARKGQHVYYAEGLTPGVHVGEHVKAGQMIGRATTQPTGLELGFGAGAGRTLAQATTGYKEGEQTVAGKQFTSFISGIGKGGTALSVLSKAAEAAGKAAERAAKALTALGTKGEGEYRKLEQTAQTGGVKQLEKLLGTTSVATVRTYLPPNERMGTTLVPGGGIQEAQFVHLVDALRATHDAGLEKLAGKLVTAHTSALRSLNAQLAAAAETADARKIALETTEARDLTTITANMASQVVQAMKDAAQAITDAFTAQATAIRDRTQEASDASAATVKAIQDQAKINVDTLAERGLFGLNLVAQQQQAALDKITQGFDVQLAGAQQAIDSAQTASDKAAAATTAIVDAVTIQQNVLVSDAQAHLDRVTKEQDQAVQEAANANDAAAAGTAAQRAVTEAALKKAEAVAAATVQQAQAALNSAQQNASKAEAEAQNAVGAAKGNAEVVLAEAQRVLAEASSKAGVAEAEQQALVEETREKAQVQYAGGGASIHIEGLPMTDAQAIASAVSWSLRTQVPA